MSCPSAASRAPTGVVPLTLRARPRRLGLVGNPNVGKSVVFGRLTGRYATVANYPGTTVGVTRGRALVGGEVYEVIDTPGANAVEGLLSEDEQVTRRILSQHEVDIVVQVADARNLRRALMLSAELAQFGLPMVLVLNMVDEAREAGVDIDTGGLASALGIPVIETVAVEGRGISDLRKALTEAARLQVLMQTDEARAAWAHDTAERFRRVNPRPGMRLKEHIARAVREPATGLPILVVVLYAMYLGVGVFGAQTLVGLLEHGLFRQHIIPAVAAVLDRYVPATFVRELLVGDYGFISMGLTYALAIVLPIVATFFLMFGWLEDSGYIPRLAIFSDRILRAMGLNGKAVLPMVLGLGCDTMATLSTRMLATRKERVIAVLLLALGIPCSAQLATILGILGGISFAALATVFGVVLIQIFLVGFLAARLLPGSRSDFMLELPPIRWPLPAYLLRKTAVRIRWYFAEAVPLFLAGTLLLFALSQLGVLVWLTDAAQPVVTGLLGLPAQTAEIFIMGFLRRDYGAAGLFQLARQGALSGVQAVVALAVMTLFVPCIANLLMIIREQGARTAALILLVVTAVALATGTVLNHGFNLLGIAF